MFPDFGEGRPEKATDFNDLYLLKGLEAVRKRFEEIPETVLHDEICTEQHIQTNDDAKEYLSLVEKIQPPIAIFAEEQTSGRGRGNKKWTSPYGKNIYCSLAWTTDLKPHDLDGLSLCVAVVIVNCLKKITSKKLDPRELSPADFPAPDISTADTKGKDSSESSVSEKT